MELSQTSSIILGVPVIMMITTMVFGNNEEFDPHLFDNHHGFRWGWGGRTGMRRKMKDDEDEQRGPLDGA